MVEELAALLADLPAGVEGLLVGGGGEHLAHEEVVVTQAHALDHAALQVGQVLAASADEEAFEAGWKVGEEGGQLLHHLGENLYAALSKAYRA